MCIWNVYGQYAFQHTMQWTHQRETLLKNRQKEFYRNVVRAQHRSKISRKTAQTEIQVKQIEWAEQNAVFKRFFFLCWRRSIHRWCYAKNAIYTHIDQVTKHRIHTLTHIIHIHTIFRPSELTICIQHDFNRVSIVLNFIFIFLLFESEIFAKSRFMHDDTNDRSAFACY